LALLRSLAPMPESLPDIDEELPPLDDMKL